MKTSKKLIVELKSLNEKLDSLQNNSRYMIYSANPIKFAWYSFMAGVFHSLGTLFGTFVIAATILYFASQINFVPIITNWMTQILSQVRWEKIVPTPQIYR